MASSWHKWQPDAGSHFGNQGPVAKSEWPPSRSSHVGVNPQWQPSGNQIFETLEKAQYNYRYWAYDKSRFKKHFLADSALLAGDFCDDNQFCCSKWETFQKNACFRKIALGIVATYSSDQGSYFVEEKQSLSNWRPSSSTTKG